MVDVIQRHIDSIKNLCSDHHLLKLYIVGSAARGTDFTPDSDIDLLYEFDTSSLDFDDPSNSAYDYEDNYFTFYEAVEKLLQRRVDLIPLKEIKNKYLMASLEEDKILLYENKELEEILG